jgi:hypothetical protein
LLLLGLLVCCVMVVEGCWCCANHRYCR